MIRLRVGPGVNTRPWGGPVLTGPAAGAITNPRGRDIQLIAKVY